MIPPNNAYNIAMNAGIMSNEKKLRSVLTSFSG